MVFDPDTVPASASEFQAWFQAKMEEIDDCLIQDPEATTPELRAWYANMAEDFPDYNATAATDGLGDSATGYSSCPTAILADFRWSKADAALRRVTELAVKHRLGFYDVSGSKGQVWAPNKDGEFVLLFELNP